MTAQTQEHLSVENKMSNNYNRDEILVYIKRTSYTGKVQGGVIGNWEYYQMASLPTNDNPRYSHGDNNPNQSIISTFYYKLKNGPSDIGMQLGPYPKDSGKLEDGTVYYFNPEIMAQVKLYMGETNGVPEYKTFYQSFVTDEKYKESHIPYRNYQLSFDKAVSFPYLPEELIHGTGIPEIKIRKYDGKKRIANESDFNGLPSISLVSGIPRTLRQSGILTLTTPYPDETVYQTYAMEYHESYIGLMIDTLELDSKLFTSPTTETSGSSGKPKITINPTSVTVKDRETCTFSAAATNYNTVKWQQSIDGGQTFADIPNQTTTEITLEATKIMTGYQYRAVFTNAIGSSYTIPAILSITGFPPKISSGRIFLNPEPLVYNTGIPNINPYPNKFILMDRGIVTDLNGVYPPWGLTAWHEIEKRREAGTQLHKMPLHEMYNRTKALPCQATYPAYKIGPVGPSTSDQYFVNNATDPDMNNKITWTPRQAVYIFNNNPNSYKRQPECWPWSCRRWQTERKDDVDPQNPDANDILYYSQNQDGKFEQTTLDKIPKLNITYSTFTGHGSSKSPYILDSGPTLSSNEESYIKGYYFSKIPIPIGDLDDSQLEQCGCDPDDAKVEFAIEMFPVLHKAVCKIVLKAGFLCYKTLTCTVPDPGVINKKIIYPFNSCKFNEDLQIDLQKFEYPDLEINNNSLDFYESPKAILSYVFSSGKLPIVTDPYTHENGVTESLDGGTSIDLTGKTGFVSVAARFPCKYSTDVHVYTIGEDYTMESFSYPLNVIHDCETDYLGKVSLRGNATDYPEDPEKVMTGGDYYIDSQGKRVMWNIHDKDSQSEVYPSRSLGNAGLYMTFQDRCCEYCAELKEGAILVDYFSNPICFELDKEATSEGLNHYEQAGSCKIDQRKPCDENRLVQGKATLRGIAKFYGPADELEANLDVYAINLEFDGSLLLNDSGFIDVNGNGVSGVPSVWVLGDIKLEGFGYIPEAQGDII
jgi:hypothetical protein